MTTTVHDPSTCWRPSCRAASSKADIHADPPDAVDIVAREIGENRAAWDTLTAEEQALFRQDARDGLAALFAAGFRLVPPSDRAPALPTWLDFPGDHLAIPLPDGGWRARGDVDYRSLPRRPASATTDGCGGHLLAPEREDEPQLWACTLHHGPWHIAVGAAVMAVWRLPDGGDWLGDAFRHAGEAVDALPRWAQPVVTKVPGQ